MYLRGDVLLGVTPAPLRSSCSCVTLLLVASLAVKRQQEVAAQKAAQQAKEVLDSDATIFDYDGWLTTEEAPKRAKKVADARVTERRAQYVPQMLKIAQRRELDSERVYERKLIRELKADEHEFPDKEKLITAGYKKKLEERRRVRLLASHIVVSWHVVAVLIAPTVLHALLSVRGGSSQHLAVVAVVVQKEEEQRLKDAETEDVTKKEDMTTFYRNMLGAVTGEGNAKRRRDDESDDEVAVTPTATPTPEASDDDERRDRGRAATPVAASAEPAVGSAAGASGSGGAAAVAAAPSSAPTSSTAAVTAAVATSTSASAGAASAAGASSAPAAAEPPMTKEQLIAAARERALARRAGKAP
jgi:hypothetical protein